MRWILRIVVVLLLAAQGWRAARATRFVIHLGHASVAYDEGDGPAALSAAEAAMAADDGPQEIWAWLGDTAAYVYRHPPEAGRPDPETDRLAQLAWKGYAGAVLRCPIDSWSWSGLGEVAQREARRRDRGRPIELNEIDRRGEGILNGKYAVALAASQIAVDLQPSGAAQLDGLARIHEATGEIEKARDTYVLSARLMPDPSMHSWGSGRKLYRGLYEAILGGLREGLAQGPRFERSQWCLDIGRFARSQGDFATAIEFFHAARDAAADAARDAGGEDYWRFQAAFELGGVLEESGRFPEAMDELRKAHDLGLSRGVVSRRLGSLEARFEKYSDACVHLKEAVYDDVQDLGLRAEASRACERAGEIDLAAQLLEEVTLRPTEDLAAARALLDFYRRVGRDRTAAGVLRAWRREYPDQPEFEKWAAESPGPNAP